MFEYSENKAEGMVTDVNVGCDTRVFHGTFQKTISTESSRRARSTNDVTYDKRDQRLTIS